MTICAFPDCYAKFNGFTSGAVNQKYCHPHGVAVRKAQKKKYYQEIQKPKAQKITRDKKYGVDRKCIECPNQLPIETTLGRKICDDCRIKHKRRMVGIDYKKRKLIKTYTIIQESIKNNTMVYINVKQ